jgi:hypothetical protein
MGHRVKANSRVVPPPVLGPDQFYPALGIEFVSLSEQVDTSTPTGKMVFAVLGAVAELERSLIRNHRAN